jgi:peroxiredoxin family protein
MTQAATDPTTIDGTPPHKRRIAIVASKGTLDQAYPPMILASTAVSLGWEAGIYFTFYGLDILHSERFDKLKVASLANPAGPIQLPNALGAMPGATAAATRMMKKWMTDARMPTIPEFIDMTRDLGVRFFACATTMGVMGVTEDDLIPGADIAGAAAFLDFAADADVSLFV